MMRIVVAKARFYFFYNFTPATVAFILTLKQSAAPITTIIF